MGQWLYCTWLQASLGSGFSNVSGRILGRVEASKGELGEGEATALDNRDVGGRGAQQKFAEEY